MFLQEKEDQGKTMTKLALKIEMGLDLNQYSFQGFEFLSLEFYSSQQVDLVLELSSALEFLEKKSEMDKKRSFFKDLSVELVQMGFQLLQFQEEGPANMSKRKKKFVIGSKFFW